MLHVAFYKDIGEYQEKIVGKLSLRTLICLAGGFATAIAVGLFVHFVLRMDVSKASLPIMAFSMPFWLAGFWRPKGMKVEGFLPLFFFHEFTDDRIYYKPTLPVGSLLDAVKTGEKPSRKARKKVKRKGAELYEPSKG